MAAEELGDLSLRVIVLEVRGQEPSVSITREEVAERRASGKALMAWHLGRLNRGSDGRFGELSVTDHNATAGGRRRDRTVILEHAAVGQRRIARTVRNQGQRLGFVHQAGRREPQDLGVSAPSPALRVRAQARLDRVESDVPEGGEQVLVGLYQATAIPTLEQMPDPVVSTVERLCVGAVEPGHPTSEVWSRRLEDQVIVVDHQAVGQAGPVAKALHTPAYGDELCAVAIVFEDGLASIATVEHVVDPVLDLRAYRPGHAVLPS
jgi:hypothetical protein